MQSLDTSSPLKALGLGALLMAIGAKMWVFTLSALAVIGEAKLERAGASQVIPEGDGLPAERLSRLRQA